MDPSFLSLLDRHFKSVDKQSFRKLWNYVANGAILDADEESRALQDFRFHNDMMMADFLDKLLVLLETLEPEELKNIDEEFRAYIITFLYCNCRVLNEERRIVVISSIKVYYKILLLPMVGPHFLEFRMLSQVFTSTMEVLKDDETDDIKLDILNMFGECYRTIFGNIPKKYVELTAKFLVSSILVSTNSIVDSISNLPPVPLLCYNMLMSSNTVLKEGNKNSFYGVFASSLYRCMTIEFMEAINDRQIAVHTLTLLLEDLRWKPNNTLLEMNKLFCKQLGQGNLLSKDAANYMNTLDVNSYKYITDNMVTYLNDHCYKEYRKNVMKLSMALIANPYEKRYQNELTMSYSNLIGGIVKHCMYPDKNEANMAIEIVMNICYSENVVSDRALSTYLNQARSCSSILLRAIDKIADPEQSERNTMLLKITIKILMHSLCTKETIVDTVIGKLTKDIRPKQLELVLDDLLTVMYKMASIYLLQIAEIILRVICRVALLNDAAADRILQVLYNLIWKPFVNRRGSMFSNESFNSIFFTLKFDFELIVTRCRHLMMVDHLRQMVSDLRCDHYGCASAICVLATEIKLTCVELTRYLLRHFDMISHERIMGPLTLALKKLMSYWMLDLLPAGFGNEALRLRNNIMDAIYAQRVLVQCLKPCVLLCTQINILISDPTSDALFAEHIMSRANYKARLAVTGEHADDSSVLYLTELSIIYNKIPDDNFIKAIDDYLIDDIFFKDNDMIYLLGLNILCNSALMKRAMTKYVLTRLRDAISSPNQIVKLFGFKMMHTLVKEITHEYDEILDFAFREVVKGEPCLSRLCIICIEDAVYHDYLKLNSETYFKFIHNMGSNDLHFFMKDLLIKRFVLSNQNDIARFYVPMVLYTHMYSNSNYPISPEFLQELLKMKARMDKAQEIPVFIFKHLYLKKKFDVLSEITTVIEELINGRCKVDDNFFNVLRDFILTFQLIETQKTNSNKEFYSNVCSMIEKEILRPQRKVREQTYYKEYIDEIRRIIIALLKLLFLENESIANMIQKDLFATIMKWIDLFKHEIMHYVHNEGGREYNMYLGKFVLYYEKNRLLFTPTC